MFVICIITLKNTFVKHFLKFFLSLWLLYYKLGDIFGTQTAAFGILLGKKGIAKKLIDKLCRIGHNGNIEAITIFLIYKSKGNFMKKYSICGLNVLMDAGAITARHAEKYLTDTDFENADITVCVSQDEISRYSARNRTPDEISAYMVEGGSFYRQLLNFDGVFLHASAVVYDGRAYLFSAPCGTGKSTHTSLWLELLGDKAYILNDDKPAIRVLENGIFAYGTPFSGKHDISVPTAVKLGGICFISRGEVDKISPMNKLDAVFKMYHASLRRIDEAQLDKELAILQKIVKDIPIYYMECTPTLNAAKTAVEVMTKGE